MGFQTEWLFVRVAKMGYRLMWVYILSSLTSIRLCFFFLFSFFRYQFPLKCPCVKHCQDRGLSQEENVNKAARDLNDSARL